MTKKDRKTALDWVTSFKWEEDDKNVRSFMRIEISVDNYMSGHGASINHEAFDYEDAKWFVEHFARVFVDVFTIDSIDCLFTADDNDDKKGKIHICATLRLVEE